MAVEKIQIVSLTVLPCASPHTDSLCCVLDAVSLLCPYVEALTPW